MDISHHLRRLQASAVPAKKPKRVPRPKQEEKNLNINLNPPQTSQLKSTQTTQPRVPASFSTEVRKKTRISRHKRADLNFSVASVEKKIRALHHGIRLEKTAPICLAAVMEFMVAHLLQCAGNQAKKAKEVEITPQHIQQQILVDPELDSLLNKLQVGTISHGGVLPMVHHALVINTRMTTDEEDPPYSDNDNSDEEDYETKYAGRAAAGTDAQEPRQSHPCNNSKANSSPRIDLTTDFEGDLIDLTTTDIEDDVIDVDE